MTTVWTIGHAHDELEDFHAALKRCGIDVLADVRSRPFIRFAHQFDRPQLEPWAAEQGLDFVFLGEELGQRPYGDEFYDAEGHTLYEPLSRQPAFLRGIQRVEDIAASRRIALLCVEEQPERCHRYHLIGRVLERRQISVLHLRRGGTVESQADLADRLGENQQSLLGQPVWRSPEPMRRGHNVPEDSE